MTGPLDDILEEDKPNLGPTGSWNLRKLIFPYAMPQYLHDLPPHQLRDYLLGNDLQLKHQRDKTTGMDIYVLVDKDDNRIVWLLDPNKYPKHVPEEVTLSWES